MTATVLRGRLPGIRDNPFEQPEASCLTVHEDGLLIMEGGLITAGFIDTHVHYPQVEMIGAYGAQLLEWLDRYTLPTELKFADHDYAAAAARLFMRELLRAGTTTAAVYCTVHPQSVDAFFAGSARWDTCMVAGKALMDRNAPGGLLEPPQTAYDQSAALIGRWHGEGRQLHCVTPRFAPASTEGLLDAAGSLLRAHDGVYLQTHLSESLAEIEWVRSLFPARSRRSTWPRWAARGHCTWTTGWDGWRRATRRTWPCWTRRRRRC